MKCFYLSFLLIALGSIIHPAAFGQPRALTPAPEFKKNRGWFNTDHPLTLAGLRGKVVLLDFWTYGCINCIHIIPDLKILEAKYRNELVIIGVHSAKFTNERETENIRRIILRYGIEHPVVNDADLNIWNSYHAEGYPTLILINPDGEIVFKSFGEGQRKLLDQKIGETVSAFQAAGKLDEKPVNFVREKDKFTNSALLFPGKVLADAESERLFIADTNHHRIVVTKLDGTLLEVIGSGREGRTDGNFAAASFNHPEGMALGGNYLYIADTENQLIRRIDFGAKKVETVAGTGQQIYNFQIGGAAERIPLNSPWDLQLAGGELFVAMAGDHQIWVLDLAKNTIVPFAGSGLEKRADGDFSKSSFAQPSGLAYDGEHLYVADAESNIIRAVDLNNKSVKTLAGGNLYDFGDADGTGDSVRLQHPLGVAFWNKNILLADTYNHRIKILNPATGGVRNFAGNGKSGYQDGAKPQFYEPGGLSVAAGHLYIADTDNQVIRVLDLATRQVSTLKINNLEPPALVN